ncbi:hypothetical protein [Ottowia thiooxydans]|uniref:hypothetical protein n=1 Tax=Ottowia thiooxydans TaxID=219182 RepID=UPI0004294CC7|nr:hypothetical protein [Ottowia thiooxydans]
MSEAAPLSASNWPGLGGLLVSRLLEFNLLPSRSLHPAQIPQLAPPDGLADAPPSVQDALHRHWSKRLLGRLGASATPVLDLDEPALPLALAAPVLLRRLALDLGIALIGSPLRHIVEREEVLKARTALGEQGMAWALDGAAQLHPGLNDAHSWLRAGWAEAAEQLGSGLLAQAWHDAPAPIRARADWKLPPGSLDEKTRVASGRTASQARDMCLQRLNQMDPTWLLCFP